MNEFFNTDVPEDELHSVEDAPRALRAAWETDEGSPTITTPIRDAAEATLEAVNIISDKKELIEAGVSPDYAAITTKLTSVELDVVMLGLHLVGFFTKRLRDDAQGLLVRLKDEGDAVIRAATDEETQALEDAAEVVARKQLARYIADIQGVSVEEAEEALAEKLAEEEEQETPVAGSWAAGSPEDDAA